MHGPRHTRLLHGTVNHSLQHAQGALVCSMAVLAFTQSKAGVCFCAQGFNLPAEGMWFWFEGMIDIFFYVDLVFNFFTAYEVGHSTSSSSRQRHNQRDISGSRIY